jgi:transcriptional regulator with PAS, ATPase and Fis domain
MQLNEYQLLFYLHALYEFANEVSKRRNVEDVLKSMLSTVVGTFAIRKGMVLTSHSGDPGFDLITYQHLEPPIVKRISQQLSEGIQDDLEEVSGLVKLSSPMQNADTLSTIRESMASAGMTTVIVLRVQGKLTAYVGLGEMLRGTPFYEHQIELLNAVTSHTEIALENALFCQDIVQENQQLKEVLHKRYRFDNIIGQSAEMQAIYQRIRQIAGYANYSVLISGESGTGKELIARAVHHHSPRKDKDFIPINCAALPRDLVESQLFGHEKGIFTGATDTRKGLFEAAEGGTIFLDEIAEMPSETQAKLLRVLDRKEFMRLGDSNVRTADVRVIAATNRDLEEALADGHLRGDLFFRFDVKIHTPPLRDKKEDIPLLVDACLEKIAEENQQPVQVMSPQGLKLLMDYHWPGNVRELENVLVEATIAAEGNVIRAKDIPLSQDELQIAIQDGLSLKASVERFKRMTIEKALSDCEGNRSKAAAQLGMSRQNLQNMMKRMNIT